MNGCEQNFVCFPLKKLAAFLAISSCWTETPLLFKAGCYVGAFPGSDALGLGAQLEV